MIFDVQKSLKSLVHIPSISYSPVITNVKHKYFLEKVSERRKDF